MMKKMTVATLVLATFAMQSAFADTPTPTPTVVAPAPTQQAPDKGQAQATTTWLGVSLSPVPNIVFKQLSHVLPQNQGVMIQAVMPDSPAKRAGLQSYDIVLSFNKQLLYSARQLSALVAASKADTVVVFSVLRNAKKQDVKVKLKARTIAPSTSQSPQGVHPMFGFNLQPIMPQAIAPQGVVPEKPMGQGSVMQQFQSVKIKSLEGDRYQAEVEYQINNGEKKTFTFEGKQDEIRQQIAAHKELPESKKNSLLNALQNNPTQGLSSGFMSIPKMPAFTTMPFFNNTPTWMDNSNKL